MGVSICYVWMNATAVATRRQKTTMNCHCSDDAAQQSKQMKFFPMPNYLTNPLEELLALEKTWILIFRQK